MKTTERQNSSRLHSQLAEDADWRSQQAQVDADIEGLARDPEADRLMAEMDAAGVPIEEQIERLKTHFVARKDLVSAVS